jgi:hypothetical protein
MCAYKKPPVDRKLLYNLYITKKMSLDKVSECLEKNHKIKIHRSTLHRQLNLYGIELRDTREASTDEYTPFRWYLRSAVWDAAKRRNTKVNKIPKNKKNIITLKYLKFLWEKQKGICPYTGIKLKLFTHSLSRYKTNMKSDIRYASLDRIDANKPYAKGNVQFVTWPINYAKNDMSDKQMKRFIKLIRQKH